EDRQGLRRRPRLRRAPRPRHRAVGGHAGPRARPPGHRRGHRVRGSAPAPPGDARRPHPGLPAAPADRARPDLGAARRGAGARPRARARRGAVVSRILERESGPIDVAAEEARVGRTTARSLAAAIALLIVSILVVTRSRAAFTTEDTGADVEFAAG